jgi:hypothetical protein
MKKQRGVHILAHIFLTSSLHGGVWSASSDSRYTLGERVPGTYWIGGKVGPKAGLEDMEKQTFLTLSHS